MKPSESTCRLTIAQTATLLDISEAIASVQNRDHLLRVICEQIQPALPFEDAGIGILNDTADAYYEFLTLDSLAVPVMQTFRELGYDKRWLPVDGAIGKAFKADQPLLIDIDQEARHYPETLYLPIFQQHGLHQLICRSLRVRGHTIGVINFSAQRIDQYSEADFPLFNSIADLVGVAAANILANEEIRQREHEKSNLLQISQAISAIRGKPDLFNLVKGQLKTVFGFDDAVVAMLDAQQKQQTIFLHVIDPGSGQPTATEKPVAALFPYDDFFESLYQQAANDQPVFFNLPASKQLFPLADCIDKMLWAGLREGVFIPLSRADQVMGGLYLFSKKKGVFSENQSPLYRNAGQQLSVAVANILANEALERQLQEITALKKQIEAENVYLQEEVRGYYNFSEIIGTSTPLHDCLIQVGMVAPTPSTVLIGGETGTGKELIARAIHDRSERSRKPLIKINCATLPANLIESELFGHERGAFTGATDRRIGKFELAQGSTLFLDEVGELPPDLQAKLLRALQEREIERLGSNKVIPIDVRIIAATNRDLRTEVQAGRFRADLFFRLNVFPIILPPLRERREDIPLLVSYFVEKSNKKIGKSLRGLSTKAMQQLLHYDFPGNIRELEHLIERAAILATSRIIQDVHLPTPVTSVSINRPAGMETIQTLSDHERAYILSVLASCNGRVSGPQGAARLLGIPATTLESKMKKLGIQRQHVVPE